MVWLQYNMWISPIQGLFPNYTLPYSRFVPKLYFTSFPNDCLPIIGMFLRNAYDMYQKLVKVFHSTRISDKHKILDNHCGKISTMVDSIYHYYLDLYVQHIVLLWLKLYYNMMMQPTMAQPNSNTIQIRLNNGIVNSFIDSNDQYFPILSFSFMIRWTNSYDQLVLWIVLSCCNSFQWPRAYFVGGQSNFFCYILFYF